MHRELRAKDLERLNTFIDDLKAKEKRGLTKDQKEDLAAAQKVKDFVETGVDVRSASSPMQSSSFHLSACALAPHLSTQSYTRSK